MRSFLKHALALSTLTSTVASAQVPYNDCGTIVPGTACMFVFQDSVGQNWLLDDYGGFTLGAQVQVMGSADAGCLTSCMIGCLAVSSIGPCTTGVAFCPGDGSGTQCPCGNNSAPGQARGCLNSLGTAALLSATGMASVASDTIVLAGSGMPDSSALYFQGTTQFNGGSGVVFGDGLRCVGGAIVRLGVKINAGGASQFPAAGDPSVSIRGGVAAGDIREYQVWYRNAASFCSTATFNLSNGLEISWGP